MFATIRKNYDWADVISHLRIARIWIKIIQIELVIIGAIGPSSISIGGNEIIVPNTLIPTRYANICGI